MDMRQERGGMQHKKRKRSARSRRRRRSIALRTGLSLVIVLGIAAAAFGYYNSPGQKADRLEKQADALLDAGQYEEAIDKYTQADGLTGEVVVERELKLAQAYEAAGDTGHAAVVLLEGWQLSGQEELLAHYSAYLLNESVAEINDGTADLDTIERILEVLQQDGDQADALELLETAYDRILGKKEGGITFLDGAGGEETCDFEAYRHLMEELLALQAQNENEQLTGLLARYAVIDREKVDMSLAHLDAYRELLLKVEAATGDDRVQNLLACLDECAGVRDYFAPVFAQFEQENFEIARELLVSEEYLAVRDGFLNGTTACWWDEGFVPVTKEAVTLLAGEAEEGKETGTFGFRFIQYLEEPLTEGIIRVWGLPSVDLGHQRSGITYIPAYDGTGAYYPHKEYEILYWYTSVNHVAANDPSYARYNYRFEERTYTETDVEIDAIIDWGGSAEYRDHYDE